MTYDHSGGKNPQKDLRSLATSAKDSERRDGDRLPVFATAEVVEMSSGARFATRTSDLGPGGCFIDTLTPFPVGSQVRVTVYRSGSQFETRGSVVYSQAGLGMGIAFEALDPAQRESLDRWLAEVTGGKMAIPESKRPVEKTREVASDRTALIRMVQLLISKGILTEAEGSSVFHDPLI